MLAPRARFPRCPAVLFAAVVAMPAAAQHPTSHAAHAAGDSGALHLMAQAVPLITDVTAGPGGGARTEAALTQTIVMARGAWWRGRVALDITLDAEGLTMRTGELSLGAFGEGFVDRRHPHTWLHELLVTASARVSAVMLSASAGRGFAPFGTDDPMARPFVKYPVNHHLAQVLERGIVLGAARAGPVILEAGTFTGEEPESPSSLPLARRFGDSWAVRATLVPVRWAELQSSYARIASPEQADGLGLDQRKQSISGRVASVDGSRYLLAEWGRTVEHDHLRREDAFAFETALVEGRIGLGRVGMALRLEQTERPEEERLEDPFRTPRPHTDLHITGITRWRTATLHVDGAGVTRGRVHGVPFLEISRLEASARDVRAVFHPEAFYGRSRFWMTTAGVRLAAGARHARMGRYGVARSH